jgi:hypothetical protein
MTRVTSILDRMPAVAKPQQKFLRVLLDTIMVVRGQVNFLNMSRYSQLSERTFRRQFRQPFDWTEFHRQSIKEVSAPEADLILAQDASFLKKSGKQTFGLDRFFNGCAGRAERGLEVSLISVIDVERNFAMALSLEQTPARLTVTQSKRASGVVESRIDFYLQHLVATKPSLPEGVRLAVFDGYYAKRKFVDGVCQMNLHIISKLRSDANLRYLYQGPQKKRGRSRRDDGKVDFADLRRFHSLGEVEAGIHLSTAVVNHQRLGRDLRVVVVVRREKGKRRRLAVLFSTDTTLEAKQIYRYYKARFQIEFLFRDAKQHPGLGDCQARDKAALSFHFNASLAAVNLARVEALVRNKGEEQRAFSLSSMKQRRFNEHLLERIITKLELEPSAVKSHAEYESLCSYGAIAA